MSYRDGLSVRLHETSIVLFEKEDPMKIFIQRLCIHASVLTLLFSAAFTMVGCDNKEKILDVETPGGQIEIERDRGSGAVGVEIDKK